MACKTEQNEIFISRGREWGGNPLKNGPPSSARISKTDPKSGQKPNFRTKKISKKTISGLKLSKKTNFRARI